MSVVLPKPKSITSEEVVLSRDDWDELVAALDIGEDADDIAAVAAARAEDGLLAARLEAERGCPVEMTVPLEVVQAELDGVHPAQAWREYRGWSEDDLARKSGVARKSIEQIESRRTAGGAGPLSRLARTLGIPMEFLVEEADDIVM